MITIYVLYILTFYIQVIDIMDFTMFWNSILSIQTFGHTIHIIMYYIWSGKYVFSDSKMSGTPQMFTKFLEYRIFGLIDGIFNYFVLIVLFISGNLYLDKYLFWLYIYPLCIFILQISNWSTDYRNRILCRGQGFQTWFYQQIAVPKWKKARRSYLRRHPSQGGSDNNSYALMLE